VHSHLARNMSEHLMPVIETDFEGGIRERLYDFPLETDKFFVISHILHQIQQEQILCQHKKRDGRINPRVPQSCVTSVCPLSRDPYALFKCAHSVLERKNVVNKPRESPPRGEVLKRALVKKCLFPKAPFALRIFSQRSAKSFGAIIRKVQRRKRELGVSRLPHHESSRKMRIIPRPDEKVDVRELGCHEMFFQDLTRHHPRR